MRKALFMIALIAAIIFSGVQSNQAEARNVDAVVVNCNEWITLRSRPSVYGDSLARIPLGTRIIVDTDYTQNGFYNVYYAGMWGWCLTEYVRVYY